MDLRYIRQHVAGKAAGKIAPAIDSRRHPAKAGIDRHLCIDQGDINVWQTEWLFARGREQAVQSTEAQPAIHQTAMQPHAARAQRTDADTRKSKAKLHLNPVCGQVGCLWISEDNMLDPLNCWADRLDFIFRVDFPGGEFGIGEPSGNGFSLKIGAENDHQHQRAEQQHYPAGRNGETHHDRQATLP